MDDGDDAFGSPFDVGPVVPDHVDVDDVLDGQVDVGPVVELVLIALMVMSRWALQLGFHQMRTMRTIDQYRWGPH